MTIGKKALLTSGILFGVGVLTAGVSVVRTLDSAWSYLWIGVLVVCFLGSYYTLERVSPGVESFVATLLLIVALTGWLGSVIWYAANINLEDSPANLVRFTRGLLALMVPSTVCFVTLMSSGWSDGSISSS